LIVIQLIKKFSAFMEHKSSLPYLQKLTSGPYPEPDESNPHLYSPLL